MLPEDTKPEDDLDEDLGLEDDLSETQEAEPSGEEVEGEPLFEIEGKGITLEEAKKGYLRQSDYTVKTQTLAEERKKLEPFRKAEELLKQRPELAQKVRALVEEEIGKKEDPTVQRLTTIEDRLADQDLDREIQQVEAECKARGDDFDEKAILKVAMDEGLPSFRSAYRSWAFEKQRAKGREEEATHQAKVRTGKVARSGSPKDRTPKPKVIRNYQDAVEAAMEELD